MRREVLSSELILPFLLPFPSSFLPPVLFSFTSFPLVQIDLSLFLRVSLSLSPPLAFLSLLATRNHFRRNPASTRLAFALLSLLCSSASSALLVLFCFFRFVQSSSPARESLAAMRLPLEAAIQKRKLDFYPALVSLPLEDPH